MAITRPLLVCAVLCLAFALPERFNIEEEMAPKSFSVQYYRYPSLTSSTMENFHEKTLDFNEITPTLVFGYGTGYQQKEKMVKWNELKNSFTKKGKLNFNDLVTNFPSFKRAQKLVVISHGWSDGKVDSCDDAWVSKMARTIRENDLNVATIALCWNSKFWTQIKPTEIFGKSSKQSGVGKLCLASFGPFSKIYFTHAATTGKVGEFLASILRSIRLNNKRIFIHGIGHSLGAHIMGNIFNFGGLKLDRISGLDPAGPCFEGKLGDIRLPEKGLTKWGLNADAAEFVDNYHTDGKNYGTYSSMGDMDIFIGEVDEDGVSDISSQPTCFTCATGCCHNIVRAYFTESIVQKDHFQTAYQSNFVATEPNGTTWVHQSSKIDKQHGNSKMYAGYHAEKPTYFLQNKRMFLPMFNNNNNNYDEDEWAAVCDLENLREKEKDYCVAQGSKMISSSTGPTHSTHSTTHSSQALHTTSSIRPGTTRSTFWIGSAATKRSTPTTTATTTSTTTHSTFWIGLAATTRSTPATTATTTTRSTFWIASTATTRSTPTTTATTITTTTRSTFWIASEATTRSTPSTTATTTTNSRNLTEGNYTSSDGRITVHYREEQARSKERKVSFRCKNDVVKICFVNNDTYKIWGKGYTKQKADYYRALAKNYADSNCTSRTPFGPDYCFWDRKQC